MLRAAPVPPALRRMRIVATALLVAMAGTYVVARVNEGAYGWVGYVRAFAEAAMVGGLADWFAVTALFRHPLGLPIPHTAIVPRNRDRIADQLGAFLRDNFLVARVVARRMGRIDVAAAAGRWLSDPGGLGGGRLRRGAARLVVDALQSLDQDRLGGMVRAALSGQLRRMAVAPMMGRALASLIAQNRHTPLIEGGVRWASRALEANEAVLRQMISTRAGSVLRWTGLDATLATAILDGAYKLLREVADDPEHPLRYRAEEGLATLAIDLQLDTPTRAKVEAFKASILDSPAATEWWQGIWDSIRMGLLRAAQDPDRLMAGGLGDALRQLGVTLQADAALRTTINRFVRRAAVGTAVDYGDAIVRLVSDTVRTWDTRTLTGRLENAVGRDLQFIRINGTLVGGSVGVAIHAANALV